jgi:hypothetical protein
VYPFMQLFEEQQVLHRVRVSIESMRYLRRGVPNRRETD